MRPLAQVRLIHQHGFDEEERAGFTKYIHRNVLQAMKVLLEAVGEIGETILDENQDRAARVNEASLTFWSSDLGDDCKFLWLDPAVQKVCRAREGRMADGTDADGTDAHGTNADGAGTDAGGPARGLDTQAYERRNEFQLSDSCAYFLDSIDRLNAKTYLPEEADLLRVRLPTTGIVENTWNFKGKTFTILDMGGQRSERRKWIHHFSGVTSIIFVAALSDYNQMLYEDETTNRMHESLQLFESIVNNALFKDTPIMLFLNKVDLFREKIAVHDLKCCFPEYTGGCDYEQALKFIEDKFVECSQSSERAIYIRHTCAIDTELMRFIFDVTTDILIRTRLQNLNLL